MSSQILVIGAEIHIHGCRVCRLVWPTPAVGCRLDSTILTVASRLVRSMPMAAYRLDCLMLRVTMVSVVPFRSACSTTIRTASPSGCRSSTSRADERTGDMPPPWLEIVYVVVSMAIVIGLFSLGVWMVKRSFRIKRKWVCWLVRILGILISGYILVCFIVYFVYCRTGL